MTATTAIAATSPAGRHGAGSASPRYAEPKERSAELLRVTLVQMGKHEAAFNPLTFALWYEYSAATNPPLTQAVDKLLNTKTPVDDVRVLELYKRFIAPAGEDAMETIGSEMLRLMTSVAQSASQAGAEAGSFGVQLEGLTAALGSRDAGQLQARVAEVMAGTVAMKSTVGALQQRVQSSQAEINRLRADLERARVDAMIDPLTGILNRKGLDQRLQAMLDSPTGRPGSGHCLVMLDIDHFKKVNDNFGHLVGDRVIQGLGEVLRHSVTQDSHCAARYGGEEFAIVMPATTLDNATAMAEAVRARVKALRFRDRGTKEVMLSVTISAGVAQWRPGEESAAFVARADAALYASKHGGRDRVTRAAD